MRFVLAMLLWLLATAALAVALPTVWAEANLVDDDGYAAFAQRAAADPTLQQAVANELTTQVLNLGGDVEPALVQGIASSYTSGSAFPEQFAQANRFAHRWMFTDQVSSGTDAQGRWVVDIGPMLNDSAFNGTLDAYNITVPASLPVPLTQNAPDALRPGQLRSVATWGPWFSVGVTVLAGVCALLTLAAARSRGKALAALGVSALLVGAAGWAGVEIGRRRVDAALNNTSGDIREIADVMVDTAIASMHQWLNITLIVGGALVVLGVLFAMLGGLRQRTVREPF
ncbi:hypothetical protein [Mycolicibacterium mengxianglii]|uniref:hypothetical protein n=1 Tax=Mycolicibacterium mengxianglii TaxID=2736649 RepID=UPI0018EF2C5F|nr:hypothetical protein [Mycolicibacterium mengxianglii]